MSASFMVASETSPGPYTSLPTKGPKVGGSSFTYPDGSDEYNTNDIVDVLWVTDALGYSIQLNCTLNATGEHVTTNITKHQGIDHGRKYSLVTLLQKKILDSHSRWLITCRPTALNNIDGLQFHPPNGSAICNLCMLDAKGNYLAVSAQFNIRDAGDAEKSSKTWGSWPKSLPTSYTAASMSSTLTMAATLNATLTASSSSSSSTSASSPPVLTAYPTKAASSNSSTVPTEAAA